MKKEVNWKTRCEWYKARVKNLKKTEEALRDLLNTAENKPDDLVKGRNYTYYVISHKVTFFGTAFELSVNIKKLIGAGIRAATIDFDKKKNCYTLTCGGCIFNNLTQQRAAELAKRIMQAGNPYVTVGRNKI